MKKYVELEIEVKVLQQDVICASTPTFGSGEGDDYGTDFWE